MAHFLSVTIPLLWLANTIIKWALVDVDRDRHDPFESLNKIIVCLSDSTELFEFKLARVPTCNQTDRYSHDLCGSL